MGKTKIQYHEVKKEWGYWEDDFDPSSMDDIRWVKVLPPFYTVGEVHPNSLAPLKREGGSYEEDPSSLLEAEDAAWLSKVKLSTDAATRKGLPVASGFVDYFPDAMVAVAELSKIGNDQHNPGKALFWDREKSGDESDALMRHFLERGTIDSDGVRHSAKVAWRAMALLQKEIEQEGK